MHPAPATGGNLETLLSSVRGQILRPEDPEQPQYTSAAQILNGIEEIGQRLGQR